MAKLNKRIKAIQEKVGDTCQPRAITQALNLVKDCASAKFDETVDISVNLGLDPRKSDQVVRGATLLPKGTGRSVRVAVFTQGDNARAATEAGADIVGMDDLAQQVKAGQLDFDVVIASPDAMRIVGQVGQILGPRGLMPNPKVGTVTTDIVTAVQNAKSGQVRYRTDKNCIIHCSIGRVSFSIEDLQENLIALLTDLKRAKPSAAKGTYIKKVTVSSTMGPGLAVDMASLSI